MKTMLIAAALSVAGVLPSAAQSPAPAPAPVPLPAPAPAPMRLPLLARPAIDLDVAIADATHALATIDLDAALAEANAALATIDVDRLVEATADLSVEWAQAPNPAPVPPVPFFKDNRDEEQLYDRARSQIESSRYDQALSSLERVIAEKGKRAEAAMYWKAYSLSKLMRRPEALTSLDALEKQYPNGVWLKDARALEVEIRQAMGQNVSAEAQGDEELKLLALRGLMQTDAETALPAVEKMLAGSSSVRVKDRALFLISQSRSPRGAQLLTSVAKGNANPDLQEKAITYLGRMRAGSELEDVYRTVSSVDLKKRIIQSLGEANAADKLVAVARGEKNSDLKLAAVQRLSTMRSPEAQAFMLEIIK